MIGMSCSVAARRIRRVVVRMTNGWSFGAGAGLPFIRLQYCNLSAERSSLTLTLAMCPALSPGWRSGLVIKSKDNRRLSNLEQLPILIKLYPNRRLYDA